MPKYYLLSNSPDRTRVSLLDTERPIEEPCRTLMLWGVSQLPILYQDETLDADSWVETTIDALSPEDRIVPERIFLTCSGDHLRTMAEKVSRDVTLVAEYDAVTAYYERQQKALSSGEAGSNVLLLTSGRDGFRAERLCETGLEVLRFTPGTASLDQWLAEHNLEKNSDALSLYRRDPQTRADLHWEIREMRHMFLELLQEGETEFCRYQFLNGENSPTLTVNVQVGLPAMAAIAPQVQQWLQEFAHFLDQIQTAWGIPTLVLCNGKDWMMEDLLDSVRIQWPTAQLCCTGAHEAAGRGLELLAPTLLTLRGWEKTWSRTLCTDQAWTDEIKSNFNSSVMGRIRLTHDTWNVVRSTIYEWQAADFRKGEIMNRALEKLEHDFTNERWAVFSASDTIFLTAVQKLELALGATLLETKEEKEFACHFLYPMLRPCFSDEWLGWLKEWMQQQYSPIVSLFRDHVAVVDVFHNIRDREQETYQPMLDTAGFICRQKAAHKLEEVFPLAEKTQEYLSLTCHTIQMCLLRKMDSLLPYPSETMRGTRDRLQLLWTVLPEGCDTPEKLLSLRDQLWFLQE